MKFVAFMRAMNVGGRTVKMTVLRELFEKMKFSEVETFIASGNVIFRSRSRDGGRLEARIERHLEDALGLEFTTFVRDEEELPAILENSPFSPRKLGTFNLYIGMTKASPGKKAIVDLAALSNDIDEIRVAGREIYWLCRTGMSESRITGAKIEKALGGPATFRNVTTMRRLVEKL